MDITEAARAMAARRKRKGPVGIPTECKRCHQVQPTVRQALIHCRKKRTIKSA